MLCVRSEFCSGLCMRSSLLSPQDVVTEAKMDSNVALMKVWAMKSILFPYLLLGIHQSASIHESHNSMAGFTSWVSGDLSSSPNHTRESLISSRAPVTTVLLHWLLSCVRSLQCSSTHQSGLSIPLQCCSSSHCCVSVHCSASPLITCGCISHCSAVSLSFVFIHDLGSPGVSLLSGRPFPIPT